MELDPVRILLVDDRLDGLITMEAVLRAPNYILVKAQSGVEALAHLKEQDFAVILLDVQMPGMDGFQTAAKIKDIPRARGTPIIFVTAINKDPFYIYQGYHAGAVDYIFKPFEPYVLQSKVAVFADLYQQKIQIQKQADEIQIKEAELSQARKLEVVGRLAGGVAHDFNNLVTGILGLSHDVWMSLEPEDPRRSDLDEIIKAANRAFSLTKQLLAFGRRQMISPQIVDINVVILDINKMLRRLIGEDIDIKTRLNSRMSMVRVDPVQLEQIILNLALNARDAMPHGGTLTLTTSNYEVSESTSHAELLPGHYVVLQIADTGCGMDAEVLSHIFEPFFSTKDKDKGTGLGLATVYGIVKQNRGHITVQSDKNKGTTFEIALPYISGLRAIEGQKAPKEQTSGTETILVVEDEEIVRRVTVRALRKSGYEVFEAQDPQTALSWFENFDRPLHLLITDVVMPKMNGRELASTIVERRPQTAVLYMSGYSEDLVVHRGIVDPGIHFIEKSFSTQTLVRKVREVLDSCFPKNDRPARSEDPALSRSPS